MLVGFYDLSHRKSGVDNRHDVAGFNARPNVLSDSVEAMRARGSFKAAQRAARQSESFHKHSCEINLALHAAHDTDTDDPGVLCG